MKKMSKAYAEVDAFRDACSNSEAEKVQCKELSCVVYLYLSSQVGFVAKGYVGRSKKPVFHYRFNTIESRSEHVSKWMTEQLERAERLKPVKRELQVGDVLSAQFGYEQTNYAYYLVTGLFGKTMVDIVKIGQKREYTGDMQGICFPDITSIIGVPVVRKIWKIELG